MSGFFSPDQVSIDSLAPELAPLRDAVSRLLQGQLSAGPQQQPSLYPGLPGPFEQLYGVGQNPQAGAPSFYNATPPQGNFGDPTTSPVPIPLTGTAPNPTGPVNPVTTQPPYNQQPTLDPNLLSGAAAPRGVFGVGSQNFGPFQPLQTSAQAPTTGQNQQFTPSFQNQVTQDPGAQLRAAFEPGNVDNDPGGADDPTPDDGLDDGQVTPGGDPDGGRNRGGVPGPGGSLPYNPFTGSGSLDLAQFGGPYSAPLLGGQLNALSGVNNLFNPTPIVQNQDMQGALFRALSGNPTFNPNLGVSFGSTVAPFDVASAADPFFTSLFGAPPGPTQYQPMSNPFFNTRSPTPFVPGNGGGIGQLPPGSVQPPATGAPAPSGGAPVSSPGGGGGSPTPQLTGSASPVGAGGAASGGDLLPHQQAILAQGSPWQQFLFNGLQSGQFGLGPNSGSFTDPSLVPMGTSMQGIANALASFGFGGQLDNVAQQVGQPGFFSGVDASQFHPDFASSPLPPVQGLATGGFLNPNGLDIVGENGPELIPPGNQQVIPLAGTGGGFTPPPQAATTGVPQLTSSAGSQTQPTAQLTPPQQALPQTFTPPAVSTSVPTMSAQSTQTLGAPEQVLGGPIPGQAPTTGGFPGFGAGGPGGTAFLDALLPQFLQSYGTALQAPRFDLTDTFGAGERVFQRDLEDQLANVREEFSGLGLGPGSTDRENRLLQTAGDSTARFRLGQLGQARESFENAEGRRINALGVGPGAANVLDAPFNRQLQALPFLQNREQQATNNFFDVANPAQQQMMQALSQLPGFSNLPFDQGQQTFLMNEMARITADTDLQRRLGEFQRTQGGLLDQIIGLLGGIPPQNTGFGPSPFSQIGSLVGGIGSFFGGG